MRNTVLAVQPDSFPKIRRIGTKIESSPTCSTELFQSSGIFQVGSIFGGRTRISSRHCSRPGKSINAAPDLYTVPWKEGFRCLSPRDTIQPPPWQGLHPSFETVSFEGLRRHCREPLLPREEKKDSIRGTLCKCGSEDSPVLPLRSSVVHVYRLYDLTRSLLGHVHSFVIFVNVCFVATL